MKNNKFIKATSIVMSAVVASMAMGSGACYEKQTTLDKAKEFVKGLTTSQIVTDGRKFVNDVSNNVSNRDVLFFTAGSCTAAAIALGAAYYGYPNGLEDLAKHIVKVDVEGSEQVKLLALHLKNYKFEDETADAFLLISADPRKAVAASEEAQAGGNAAPAARAAEPQEEGMADEDEEEEKKKAGGNGEAKPVELQGAAPAAKDGEMLRENFVYKVASVGESEFKSWMVTVPHMFSSKPVVHGKLELVTIDASCLFGGWRNVERNEINQELANGLISKIEDSARSKEGLAKPNENDPQFVAAASSKNESNENANPENGGAGSGESESEEEVELVVYAAEQIAAGTGANADVDVTFSKDEGARVFGLKLANEVGEDIEAKGEVRVKANVTKFVDNEDGTCNFMLDGVEFGNVKFVKEEGAEN